VLLITTPFTLYFLCRFLVKCSGALNWLMCLDCAAACWFERGGAFTDFSLLLKKNWLEEETLWTSIHMSEKYVELCTVLLMLLPWRRLFNYYEGDLEVFSFSNNNVLKHPRTKKLTDLICCLRIFPCCFSTVVLCVYMFMVKGTLVIWIIFMAHIEWLIHYSQSAREIYFSIRQMSNFSTIEGNLLLGCFFGGGGINKWRQTTCLGF